MKTAQLSQNKHFFETICHFCAYLDQGEVQMESDMTTAIRGIWQ